MPQNPSAMEKLEANVDFVMLHSMYVISFIWGRTVLFISTPRTVLLSMSLAYHQALVEIVEAIESCLQISNFI
jgi:hypothetical protein